MFDKGYIYIGLIFSLELIILTTATKQTNMNNLNIFTEIKLESFFSGKCKII